jgi:tetratricopeptide (TPR) repeat protein
MGSGSNYRVAPWMQDTLREGFRLLHAGKFEEASECCRRLLGAKPDLVEAHFLVGLIATELKQPAVAISAFGSVTTLQENHAGGWANLARHLMITGQTARADAALEQAVQHNDGNPLVMDTIGSVYGLLGDQLEAAAWVEKAVGKEPRSVPFLVNLANNQMFLGKLDEAELSLRKALRYHPGNANAHWVLSNLRKATDFEHVEELERLLQNESRNQRSLSFLYYGLGKELEDLEEWDRAFEAFARGAAARRTTLEFDEAAEIEMYDAFKREFTTAWFSDAAAGHADPSPIFIIGQPRTGTTLVERIITSHSQVHSAGELKQFGMAVRRLSDYREPKRQSAKLAEAGARLESERLGKAYMATTKKFRGSLPRFVDKLPPNYLYLPMILKALPNAKVIHLTRNPMDACFASFKQLFADAYPHSYEQSEMARHHARYYHLMTTWRERFGDRFLDIAYEDTARDVAANARTLIDFLELPWEDACLNFHRQDAAVTTASAVQVRQPAHTRSIGRWRRYEKQLEPMRQALLKAKVPLGEF